MYRVTEVFSYIRGGRGSHTRTCAGEKNKNFIPKMKVIRPHNASPPRRNVEETNLGLYPPRRRSVEGGPLGISIYHGLWPRLWGWGVPGFRGPGGPQGRSVDHSVARSVGHSVDNSIDHSVDRSVAHSVDRSVGRPLGRSLGRPIRRSIARSITRSIARSITQEP
jgi:hypothetical protein